MTTDRERLNTELARRLLLSEARGYACNKLFRRGLLGDAPFPEGHVYEDVAPMLRIALGAGDHTGLFNVGSSRGCLNGGYARTSPRRGGEVLVLDSVEAVH